MPEVKLVGVCDVWDQRLEKAGVFTTMDHRELLGRTDVDAVLIATPDHLHVPLLVDACAAGKDVYVESPLTHDLAEGAVAIDAVCKSGRVVQAGLQRRSLPEIGRAREMVRAGRLGRVHRVQVTWKGNEDGDAEAVAGSVDWGRFLGDVREQPFDACRFRNWRRYWEFGGGTFTDLMVHWVDAARWILDLGQPLEAVAIGDSMGPEGRRRTPDAAQCLLRFAGVEFYFESRIGEGRNGAEVVFVGDEETMTLRGRETGRDGDRRHLENWVECVRSRREPAAPVEAGVTSAAAGHLANVALRSGRAAGIQ
jgi:predicted dehydrogenase